MKADLSQIPSTCKFTIWNDAASQEGDYACLLSERVRGRKIEASARGKTLQEAIDNAIAEFTR